MNEWPDFQIPADWSLVRMDDLAVKLKAGGTPSRQNKSYFGGDIPFVLIDDMTSSGVYLKSTKETISQAGLDACSAWIVPKNTVLLSMYATIGATVITTFPVATNQAILAIIPREMCDREYLSFCLQAHKAHLARLNVESTQKNINKGIVSSFPIPLPPLPEQTQIAHILSTVQRAIEAQERIIQTTTELKKALMHKLFTEGLRHEPQKQTEIGPVPQSWEIVRCEDVCETTSVGIVVKPTQYYVPTGVPALRSQNVRVDRMQMEPMVYISEEANDGPVAKSKLRTGDVLIVRTGANLGMSCVLSAELDGCNCIDLLFIRTNPERLNGSFLSRFINSVEAKKQVGAGKTGMAQPHFNVGTVKRIFVPLPPLEEQEVIVSCLEKIDQKHDLAEAKQKALQDLFRTLLHELMTAKTRVHNLEYSA
ncbi:MAG: restriction endonuclease subunit S [Limisphaerales bacterium]